MVEKKGDANDNKENLGDNSIQGFDLCLSKSAEAIGENSSYASTRVRYDGSTERGGSQKSISEIKDRIAACREAYENMGIIGNAIDLMVDFALEGLEISHPNPAIEKFYKNWAKKVKAQYTLEGILKGIYRDGNVPIYKFRSKLSEDEVKAFRRTIAKYDKKRKENSLESEFVDDGYKKVTSQMTDSAPVIPTKYSILDALNVYPTGNEIFGTLRYDYQVSSQDAHAMANSKSPQDLAIIEKIRREFGDEAINMMKSGRVTLDASRMSMLHYKKDDYKYWATPMLWRVIDDVKFKKLLRDMDISVAESVCNTTTIYKLGSAEKGLSPNEAKYKKFVSLLKTPTRSKKIVWDDLIDIISEYPPVDKILGREKYEQVDSDIRAGLGIAEIVLQGQGGGNYSNAFLAVKTLLERLETGRDYAITWMNEQIEEIAKAMKFRRPAYIKLRNMSLRDEAAAEKMILELVDRNMLSYRTAMQYFNENFDVEVNRMKEEDRLRVKVQDETPYVILKTGKYGPQHQKGPIPIGVVGDTGGSNESPTGQGGEGDKGGRPTGTPKKQSKKRNTKPKGQASEITIDEELRKDGLRRFNDIYSIIDEGIDIREFSASEEIEMYDLIIRAMCHIDDALLLNFETIAELTNLDVDLATAPAKLERCVKSVTQQRVQKFKQKNKRSPNKKEMKDIVSSAWAICRSSLNM